MTLQEAILNYVNECSGGCKFIDLTTDIQIKIIQGKIEDFPSSKLSVDFVDDVEKVVRNHPQLKVLEYTWHVCNRVKMFVYTP
jgi:hypothetical protein